MRNALFKKMSSAVARSSKYSYRASSTGVGANDVINIEYSADLSALSRLEVRIRGFFWVEKEFDEKKLIFKMEKVRKKWKVLHNSSEKKKYYQYAVRKKN